MVDEIIARAEAFLVRSSALMSQCSEAIQRKLGKTLGDYVQQVDASVVSTHACRSFWEVTT